MGFGSVLFSLLFFALFAVYLFFAIFIIHQNSKAFLNRLFFLLCLSLCFWSFGFSLSNLTDSAQSALFWRRISALGWSFSYSLLLHFFLALTTERCGGKGGVWCLLLHLPAIVCAFVFSISDVFATRQYNLVQTGYGWSNQAVNNGWDYFFYLYFCSYALITFVVLWLWQRRSSQENIKKQARLLLITLSLSFALGGLVDLLLASCLPLPWPQMGPLLVLIPVAALYFSMKRYNLLPSVPEAEGLLLDAKTQTRLFHYLSLGFFMGGLLSFLPRFLPHLAGGEQLSPAIGQASILLFAAGIAIFSINYLKNGLIKNVAVLSITLLALILITLGYLAQASATVWAFPILLMIVAVVFDSLLPLVLITVTAAACQILTWSHAPRGLVAVGPIHYLLRIGVLLISFWLGLVINKIYMQRLKENVYQSNFQKLISSLSWDFFHLQQDNWDIQINKLLSKIGNFFKLDRAYLVLLDERENVLNYAREWCSMGIKSRLGEVSEFPRDVFPWLNAKLKHNQAIYSENVADLPQAAAAEKLRLAADGVKSFLMIPIGQGEQLFGFIGFDSLKTQQQWSNYHRELLELVAEFLSQALVRTKAEREIEQMAYYDHLTGLPNRILFKDRLDQAIQLGKRTERFVGVVFLNLDNFRLINDTLGHAGGDAVLRKVGKLLAGHLRRADTVARFTGDEFLVLLNSIEEPKDVLVISEKIMELFARPLSLGRQEILLSASSGIAIYPVDGEDSETLIENANLAMQRAKSIGKNRFALCTLELKEEMKRNMILSNSLYRVEERRELSILYQPQLSLSSGEILGTEALLRWEHPAWGLILPNTFIPLAEKNGTILKIGQWVLQEALLQNKRWQQLGLPQLRIAVNLSPVQFNDPRIVNWVEEALREGGLAPEFLELEITESVAIGEPSSTLDVLQRLKNLGVTVAIDDFGTSYSSLSRLKSLPIDRLKIDMQFIQGVEKSKKDRAITEVIINLAGSLGLSVLAKGVETAAQVQYLREKQCHEVQGFYFHKPLTARQLEQLLTDFSPAKSK